MGGTYITIDGIDRCLGAFNGLQGELRKNANGELRAASKQIANLIPGMLGGSGAPQEGKILAASGAKSDRYVVVAVPNRKPGLRGVKRTPAVEAKRLGWALETGSDWPAFKNPSPQSLVGQHRDAIARYAIPRYTESLIDIMRKWDLI
jgi:hypothetical protein